MDKQSLGIKLQRSLVADTGRLCFGGTERASALSILPGVALLANKINLDDTLLYVIIYGPLVKRGHFTPAWS